MVVWMDVVVGGDGGNVDGGVVGGCGGIGGCSCR